MATAAQISTFISQIAPLIQAEAKKRGYKVCSPIISQACVESAFNTSSLGYRYHNYFGLKTGSSWKGKSVNLKTKEEYTVGTLTTIKDNFRVYDSMEEGVKGYFDFISTKRYAKLRDSNTDTPYEYLCAIKEAGYATSSSYVNTCMSYISRYNLTVWDEKQENPYKLTENIIKRGDRGESVKWLQFSLNCHGYNLSCDGIFGALTENAVKDFKEKQGLNLIVDNLTIEKLQK